MQTVIHTNGHSTSHEEHPQDNNGIPEKDTNDNQDHEVEDMDAEAGGECGNVEDKVQQVTEHDRETVRCLDVIFPPFYYSTRGLSRPSSPMEGSHERCV